MSWHGPLGTVLSVGAGGCVGAVLRYVLSTAIYRYTAQTGFPFGTVAVNLTGCFIIGLVGGLADSRSVIGTELRTFVVIGVLGSFTTFSTFGYDTIALLRDQEYGRMAANVALQVLLGPALAGVGYVLVAR